MKKQTITQVAKKVATAVKKHEVITNRVILVTEGEVTIEYTIPNEFRDSVTVVIAEYDMDDEPDFIDYAEKIVEGLAQRGYEFEMEVE